MEKKTFFTVRNLALIGVLAAIVFVLTKFWVASLCGALTYCGLYGAKNILEGALVRGVTWEVAIMETLTVKLPVTLVNAVIAVVCAALLYLALRQPLRKAHVLSA